MEAFELRLWDGRLGRWLTVDPYHEFHSPYLGMGNNPISLTDPDGGSTSGGGDGNCDGCPPLLIAREFGPQLPSTGFPGSNVPIELSEVPIPNHDSNFQSFRRYLQELGRVGLVFTTNMAGTQINNNLTFGVYDKFYQIQKVMENMSCLQDWVDWRVI